MDSKYSHTHDVPEGSLSHSRRLTSETAVSGSDFSRGDPSPTPKFHRYNLVVPPVELGSSTSGTRTPNRVRARTVYWTDRDWEEYQRHVRETTKKGLVISMGVGKPKGLAGGRPPVGSATIRRLLDQSRESARVRALGRVAGRKVDHKAILAVSALFGPKPTRWAAPFTDIDRVIAHTFPDYRPARRRVTTVDFCDKGVLRPAVLDPEEKAWQLDVAIPLPTTVDQYHYLRGNFAVRTLDDTGSIAG
jgi:hypothetical protein